MRSWVGLLLAAALAVGPVSAVAADPDFAPGVSSSADPIRYKAGFARFDYVNPDAPKGG